jgi:hypothetical protein
VIRGFILAKLATNKTSIARQHLAAIVLHFNKYPQRQFLIVFCFCGEILWLVACEKTAVEYEISTAVFLQNLPESWV